MLDLKTAILNHSMKVDIVVIAHTAYVQSPFLCGKVDGKVGGRGWVIMFGMKNI